VRPAFFLLPRLLVIVAVFGMLASPLARQVLAPPAAAAAAPIAADMPCCPEQAPTPDCAKSCPLMALCATQLIGGTTMVASKVSMIVVARLAPASDRPLAGLNIHPPPKPPRSAA
jgi:hypothetical protein